MSRQQVPNYELASDTARDNLLTNGGFEIWQRGVGPFTGTNFNTDRWQVAIVGGDTLSVSRDNANLDAAFGGLYCAACTFVLSGGAGSTVLYQDLKTADGSGLLNRTVSVSIRVKTATPNAVRVGVYNGSAYTYSSNHPGDGVYHTLTATTTVTAGANDVFAAVSFLASCTAYVDNAMLVIGSVPANYVPMHPADEIARCKRYYEIVGGNNSSPIFAGYNSAGASSYIYLGFIHKGAVPTATVNGTWTTVNCTGPTLQWNNVDGVNVVIINTAVGYAYVYTTTATAFFSFEANP